MNMLVVAADAPAPVGDAPTQITAAGNTQLLLAALAGIAAVVVLITVIKLHPFLSLLIASAVVALVAWVPGAAAVKSFTNGAISPNGGFSGTAGAVALLIALGAMLGQILIESGGAQRVVDTISTKLSGAALPWGMALLAALIGLPMFFEIGVVILVPIVVMVARRSGHRLILVGIPALAGLSVLHGLVPPHPGPETAIASLHADHGRTLLFGIIVAIPTLIICGPLLGRFLDRLVPIDAHAAAGAAAEAKPPAETGATRQPKFSRAVAMLLLPVALMLPDAIVKLVVTDEDNLARKILDVIGTPSVALLITVSVAYFVLGLGSGMSRSEASDSLGRSWNSTAAAASASRASGVVSHGTADSAGDGDSAITAMAPRLIAWGAKAIASWRCPRTATNSAPGVTRRLHRRGRGRGGGAIKVKESRKSRRSYSWASWADRR